MEKLTDKDKVLHCAVCAIASILCPAFAIGLALGKEYGDAHAQGNHWCWYDLLADAIGVIIGGAIHFGILMLVL